MGLFSTDKTAKREAERARKEEEARQQRIREGTAAIDRTFGTFSDAWYDTRAQDYYNAAMPTLNMEASRTRNNLTFGMANRGLLASSLRNQRNQSFENELAKQRRIVADTGIGQANELRAKVEDARSRAMSQLYQSSDPAAATATATREASGLSQASPIGPMGNFFADWSNIYLTNAAARAENPDTPRLFDWSSFGSGNNSSSRLVK